jgi:hypothetical protein
VRATAALRGIDLTALPLLLGHVVTRAKPTSEVILTNEKGDPILVWWRYGLGLALAFTSDAKARWATEWLTWPDFSAFWTQLLRHVMRQSQTDGGRLAVTHRAGTMRVTLELLDDDDAFVNRAQTRLSLLRPGGQQPVEEVIMRQTAPGTYTAELAGTAQGMHLLDVVSRTDERVRFRQTVGKYVGYPDELRLRRPDTALLKQIAAQSGGLVDPSAEQVFAAAAEPPRRPAPLWRPLVSVALVLWVVDVALRRAAWFFL